MKKIMLTIVLAITVSCAPVGLHFLDRASDGQNGYDGQDGADGVDGTDGADGASAPPPECTVSQTRQHIVLTCPDGFVKLKLHRKGKR